MENKNVSEAYWQAYLQHYNIVLVGRKKATLAGTTDRKVKTIEVPWLPLMSFSVQYDLDIASIVYTAYGVLLQKYLYASDIVFGVTASGMLNNALPFRISLNPDHTILENIRDVESGYSVVKQHASSTHDDVRSALGLQATENIFDSVLTIAELSYEKTRHGELTRQQVRHNATSEHADWPLHIHVSLTESLRMEFSYDAYYIADAAIALLAHYLPVVVHQLLRSPDASVSTIDILTEDDRSKLENFNQTTQRYPDKSLMALFEEQVARTPNAFAVFTAVDSICYNDLNIRVNQMASFLIDQGLGAGDIVSLLMERSIDFVINVLAVVKSGATYMPIEPGFPADRIQFMLSDSNAAALITTQQLLQNKSIGEQSACKVFCYDTIVSQLANRPETDPAHRVSTELYVLYTSGSTGTPKGVVGTHRGLINRLHWGWTTYPLEGAEVFCFKTSIAFVDHVVEMFSPLLSGVPVRIFSDDEVLDVSQMFSLLAANRITRMTVAPTYLQKLVVQKDRRLTDHALRYVFCSGEPLSPQLAKVFYREFSNVALVNIYGVTEASADTTACHVPRHYVDEVLQYFQKYTLSTDVPLEDHAEGGRLDPYQITEPDVTLADLAPRFQNTSIAEYPESVDKYFTNFRKDILPYLVNTASPRFIGHMTSVLPDYVHDISKLISQLNQNLVKIETSKSLTFIEREAIAILHRIFYALSDSFYREHVQKLNSNLGIITSGGSTANMSALLSARNKLLYADEGSGQSIYRQLQKKGYKDLVILGSRLMHYSFQKAALLFGIGTDNVILVKNTEAGNLDVSDLQKKIAFCREHDLLIMAIVGIAGSTETGSIDPLREMAQIARTNNIHFHVDAAWGGLVKFSHQYASLLDGIELADSITFCGHKQLFLPQGISVCLFRDPFQVNNNSTVANYQAKSDSYDFGRVTLEGSKPALSLCLHASLRVLGRKGYALLLDRGITLANTFAEMILQSEGMELISKNINIINYRYIPLRFRAKQLSSEECELINDVTTKIQETQFLKGRTFVSKTKIRTEGEQDKVVFRVVLSNPLTTHQDLECVLKDQFSIIADLFHETNRVGSVPVASGLMNDPDDETDDAKISIGKPISNTQVFIVDRHGNLLPTGFPGELCIAGDGVAKGYAQPAHVSAGKFISSPYAKGKSLYRTGDLARWLPDGTIEFMGRRDDQVKVRGHRIELCEVEASLAMHPGIHDVAVVVKKKHNESLLVAYYTAPEEIPAIELRATLRLQLPEYMIPTQFIYREVLPQISNGKMNRRLLSEADEHTSSHYVAPRTKTEIVLIDIVSGLLKTPKNVISMHQNFFELGGTSLDLFSLNDQLKLQFQTVLSLQDFFQYPTLQSMADAIIRGTNSGPEAKPANGFSEMPVVR